MELVFFTKLCMIIFSALLTPCASLQVQLQSSNKQAAPAANNELQVSLPTLPRKLRFTEKVTQIVGQEGNNKDSAPNNKQKENVLPGNNKPILHKEEEEGMHAGKRNKGSTWQEWTQVGEEDTSEFFTMDYRRVRRRPPIHNKSLPVSP